MGPDELFKLMRDVDFGVPPDEIEALPDLPLFDEKLRKRMQREVLLYRKPVLSIDDRAWGWLYLILAAHEQRAIEAAALDKQRPSRLPRKSADDLRKVEKSLRRAQASIRSARRRKGADRLIDKSIDAGIDALLGKVDTALTPSAVELDPNPIGSERGRLEFLLGRWWTEETGRAPSARTGPSAYKTFLRLCYGVLTTRPGVSDDRVQAHRAAQRETERRLNEAIGTIKARVQKT